MSKFKYYIIDLCDPRVTGTNDVNLAFELSHSEEHFIIDNETQELIFESKRSEIELQN